MIHNLYPSTLKHFEEEKNRQIRMSTYYRTKGSQLDILKMYTILNSKMAKMCLIISKTENHLLILQLNNLLIPFLCLFSVEKQLDIWLQDYLWLLML